MIYIVLFFGLLLRLISLNQSLWLDEATTALVAKMTVPHFFTNFIANDFHPPLYYLIIHYWSQIFGFSEVILRVPSIIFGVLNVYVVYLIAKEIKIKNAWLPALYLATSGLHLYYSQEARMYSLAAFLVSLLVYLYIREKWLLFSVVLPFVFLTDYVSFIIFPVLLIFTYFRDFKKLKKILYSTIPAAVVFILWSPTLIKQIMSGLSLKTESSGWWDLLGPVTFKNVALIPTKFMIGRVSMDNKYLYALVIIIISVLFTYVIGKAKNKLIWNWFGMSMLLGIILSFFIPTLTYFRYLFILPAFYLLLSESKSKIFIGCLLGINLLSCFYYLNNPKFQRENWRQAVNEIGQSKIVFPVNSQKEALIYYGKGNQIISKEDLNTNDKEIWLSRYVWNVFDPNDTTRIYIENLGYNKVREVNFNGVLLYKYAHSN